MRQSIQLITTDQKLLRRLLLVFWVVAVVSLYIGLLFPFRGEEGVYIGSSFEMLHHHNYIDVFWNGSLYGRPPLYNWLILGVAKVVGYQHMLFAARFVTVTMTVASSGVLYWLAKSLSRDRLFALFAVVCFFSGDLLFRRSWIAYADPTFAFFIFSAIACLWVGHERAQMKWLLPAFIALSAAFLTKALTCYVFYAVFALVLLWRYRQFTFFFSPISIAVHILMLVVPVTWLIVTSHPAQHHRMLDDIARQFSQNGFSVLHYLYDLLNKTLVFIARFAPLSIIVIYTILAGRYQRNAPTWVKASVWAILISILPYWLTPNVYQIRYLLPLFPFVALVFAYVLLNSSGKVFNFTLLILTVCLLFKVFVSPWGLPWFEHMSHDYTKVSQHIVQQTKNYPLYAADDDSLIATLDMLSYPQKVMTGKPADVHDGYLAGFLGWHHGKVLHVYQIGRRKIAVYCYGRACQTSWSAS